MPLPCHADFDFRLAFSSLVWAPWFIWWKTGQNEPDTESFFKESALLNFFLLNVYFTFLLDNGDEDNSDTYWIPTSVLCRSVIESYRDFNDQKIIDLIIDEQILTLSDDLTQYQFRYHTNSTESLEEYSECSFECIAADGEFDELDWQWISVACVFFCIIIKWMYLKVNHIIIYSTFK